METPYNITPSTQFSIVLQWTLSPLPWFHHDYCSIAAIPIAMQPYLVLAETRVVQWAIIALSGVLQQIKI